MSTEVFEVHIQQSLEKLEDLWQRSNSIPEFDSEVWQHTRELSQQQQLLVRESLEELSAAIEELQLASETLRQQNEELLATRQQIEAERQYYRELFDFAPDCYLITTQDGMIAEVNQKTTELLELSAKFLINKALAVFIPLTQRQEYYTYLNQIKQGKISQGTWQLEFNSRQQNSILAECTVVARRNVQGEIINLHWRISPIKSVRVDEINTVNLTSKAIEDIRYPIYNLVTQIEEIKTSNLSEKLLSDRLQNLSQDVLNLKHAINNVYILDSLKERQDLSLSLVDYSVFIYRIIREIIQRNSRSQEITFNSQDSHVGICDILLLEQIITNILYITKEYIPLNSQIQVNLTQSLTRELLIKIRLVNTQTTVKELTKIFAPIVTSNRLKLTECDDLNLEVVQKCLNLLQGTLELEANNTTIAIAIKLPLVISY